ncbi:MAG: NADH-quinone oxidoreductase subunit NuoE [Acidobacteriota bacterium]
MTEKFQLTSQNQKLFAEILKRYPNKRAAMLPTLHLVHQQQGYISQEAEEFVSQSLEVPIVDVREVTTFYTLYFKRPMGRHHIRLCMSISCWIRGADQIKAYMQEKLGVQDGQITEDGRVSWEAVPDCLGACEYAPMLQLDGYYQHELTPERVDEILEELA